MSKSREAERDKQLVKWRKERGEVILIEIYEENREREREKDRVIKKRERHKGE